MPKHCVTTVHAGDRSAADVSTRLRQDIIQLTPRNERLRFPSCLPLPGLRRGYPAGKLREQAL